MTSTSAVGTVADAAKAGDPSWTKLLESVTADCLAALRREADQDWTRPAYGLDWSCRATLDHLALGLTGYAGLLIARPTDRYITLFASLDPAADIPSCLDGLRVAASFLSSAVRDTHSEVRAWHPWGPSDTTGFAAMGIVELAVHTWDITRAMDADWAPSDEAGAAVLTRIFPDAPTGHEPWRTLLWCTGRAELPGLPKQETWRWHGAVR